MLIFKTRIVASLLVAAVFTGTGVALIPQIALADKGDKVAKPDPADNPGGKEGGKFAKPDQPAGNPGGKEKGGKAAKADQPADNGGGKGGKGDKSDYVQPDLSGTITEVSPDGKQITLQLAKSGKGEKGDKADKGDKAAEPPATFQVTGTTEVTFFAIGPMCDNAAVGYSAQVWLEPNSRDRAARVSFSGQQSLKDNRPVTVSGKITAISPDGKRLTIEGRPQAGKGEKGAKGDKGDKGAKDEKAERAVKGEKGGETQTTEVTMTPATQITFSGVTTGGASMEIGYEVQVILDPNAAGSAAAIRITGPEAGAMKGAGLGDIDLTGKVVAVANDGKSITLEGRAEPKNLDKGAAKEKPAKGDAAPDAKPAKGDAAPEGKPAKAEPQRFEVSIVPATKMIYSGVAAGGATPTEGYRASVWLDGAAAKTIHFDASGKDKKGADYSSQVIAISADGKRITVTAPPKGKSDNIPKGEKVKEDFKPEEREIDIAGAKIIFNNVHPGQATAAVGYQAQVWVDPQAPGTATVVVFSPGKMGAEKAGPGKGKN